MWVIELRRGVPPSLPFRQQYLTKAGWASLRERFLHRMKSMYTIHLYNPPPFHSQLTIFRLLIREYPLS